MKNLETYITKFRESDWLAAVETLLPEIHEVDRNAVQIWFRFYPLELMRQIAASEDREKTVREFALQGMFELKDQIDTSHHFLYGHRYWKAVKCAIKAEADGKQKDSEELVQIIKNIGMHVSEKVQADRILTTAISAVGLMTLNQVGGDAFFATEGKTSVTAGIMSRSPDAIVATRARDDSQGLLGFLKTINKRFSVNFASLKTSGKFPIMQEQEITGASANDRSQDWQKQDERCWEGPVPVECTAASCGTCWVGVLGGQEKLSAVTPRERRQMKVFGYNQPDEPRPFIRLSCQAVAAGNVTIVIPPWNGVFGKKVYDNVEHIELEPATTSAKVLRETIAGAASGE